MVRRRQKFAQSNNSIGIAKKRRDWAEEIHVTEDDKEDDDNDRSDKCSKKRLKRN